MTETPCIALLGCGEAGSAFAHDLLDRGARVRVYDPAVLAPDGAEQGDSEADVARGASLVLSVNSASVADEVLAASLPGVEPGVVWADMNTGSPEAKRRLARTAEDAGVVFADIAIMAPVPGKGLSVPLLVSGSGAERAAELLAPLGSPITIQPGGPGAAAERKLLRSVFFKGLAAAVVEALEAGRAAGCEDWLRANITEELASSNSETVERLVSGTYLHAKRRADEMAASADMLRDLGVEPLMASASRDLMRRILLTQ